MARWAGCLLGLGAAQLLLPGCRPRRGDSCDDLSDLSDTDRATRQALGYLNATLKPESDCANCTLFIAGISVGRCGTCRVVKGPIAPGGYCNSWAAKS